MCANQEDDITGRPNKADWVKRFEWRHFSIRDECSRHRFNSRHWKELLFIVVIGSVCANFLVELSMNLFQISIACVYDWRLLGLIFVAACLIITTCYFWYTGRFPALIEEPVLAIDFDFDHLKFFCPEEEENSIKDWYRAQSASNSQNIADQLIEEISELLHDLLFKPTTPEPLVNLPPEQNQEIISQARRPCRKKIGWDISHILDHIFKKERKRTPKVNVELTVRVSVTPSQPGGISDIELLYEVKVKSPANYMAILFLDIFKRYKIELLGSISSIALNSLVA